MSTRIKPLCESVRPWLRDNLGKGCLGCLTGQSGRALSAAVQIIGLYSYCDQEAEPHVLSAFRSVVMTMCPGQERELAYHAIAHVLNWSDRERIWQLAQIPPLESIRRCSYE